MRLPLLGVEGTPWVPLATIWLCPKDFFPLNLSTCHLPPPAIWAYV